MHKQLTDMLNKLNAMRDQLQGRIDNAGDSDAAQERADLNQTTLDYIEEAIVSIESAISELE